MYYLLLQCPALNLTKWSIRKAMVLLLRCIMAIYQPDGLKMDNHLKEKGGLTAYFIAVGKA